MVPDFLTIAEAGALIAKRELSPVELVLGDKRTSFGDGQEIRDHRHPPGGGKI